MDTADHLRDASPWRAEPDPIKLAILGKLSEELGELQAAIGRCIIQGVDGVHPVTGKPNIDWLREERVDVQNLFDFLDLFTAPQAFDANSMAEIARYEKKRAHIQQWLDSFKPVPFDEASKKPFIVAELLGSGWAAVHYWWNDKEDFLKPGQGFWEPYNTGIGRYATQAEADEEAKSWAENEGIRHRPPEADKKALEDRQK